MHTNIGLQSEIVHLRDELKEKCREIEKGKFFVANSLLKLLLNFENYAILELFVIICYNF